MIGSGSAPARGRRQLPGIGLSVGVVMAASLLALTHIDGETVDATAAKTPQDAGTRRSRAKRFGRHGE